jgi:DNA polymerase-3 subunit beta
MKFIISTQELNFLLSKCLYVVPQKPAMPILSYILLEAVNDELILTATDLTVGIRCFTEAKILEEGSVTLPAKRFSQLVRELTATNLEISTTSGGHTELIADSSKFKLPSMSKDEFPALPPFNEAIQIPVNQKQLKEVLYQTSFAVSREDSRYVLTGVSLTIADGKAIFVGTDGKRLSRSHMRFEGPAPANGHYILPFKAVEEIQKTLQDDGTAQLFLMDDKIALQAGQTICISKLLTGDYPDVARVIPQAPETTIALHREELMTLLRQVSLFTSEESNSVRFTLSAGELRLTVNTKDVGEGKVSMPANYQGPKLEIAFNPTYFLDILRHSKGETISLALTDSYNPGLITEESMPADLTTTPLFVLMPMRLTEE